MNAKRGIALLFLGISVYVFGMPSTVPEAPAGPTAKELILKKETFVAGVEKLIEILKNDPTRNSERFDLLLDVKNRLAWNAVQAGYREVDHYLAYQRLINAVSQLPVYWGMFSLRLMSWRNDLQEYGIIVPDASLPFSTGYDPLTQSVSWGFFDETASYIAERDLVGAVFAAKNESSYPMAAKVLAKIIDSSASRLTPDQLKTLVRAVVIFKTALSLNAQGVGFKKQECYDGFKGVIASLYAPTGEKLKNELKGKLEGEWKKDLASKGIMIPLAQ